MNNQFSLKHNDGILTTASLSPTKTDPVDRASPPLTPGLDKFGDPSPSMNIASNGNGDGGVKVGKKPTKRRTKRKKKWTKPEGKPKRPLSAYNLFFAQERIIMLGKDVPSAEQEAMKKKVHCKTHGKISFAVMAQTIGAKWKSLKPNEKRIFQERARNEKARYIVKLAGWKKSQNTDLTASGNVDEDTLATLVSNRNILMGQGLRNDQARASGLDSAIAMGIDGPTTESVGSSSRIATLSPSMERRDSALMRAIAGEEQHRRYMSLVHLRSAPSLDFGQTNGIDSAPFRSYGMDQRIPMSLYGLEGRRNLRYLDLDPASQRSSLLQNLYGSEISSAQGYNSRYRQFLGENSLIALLEEQRRMMIDHDL